MILIREMLGLPHIAVDFQDRRPATISACIIPHVTKNGNQFVVHIKGDQLALDSVKIINII